MSKKSAQAFSYTKVLSILFLVLFFVISIAFISQSFQNRLQKTNSQAAELYLDGIVNSQLKNLSWTHQQLFRPQDIPLPESIQKAKQGLVDSVYSPSVIKRKDGYYMLFSASIRCLAGGVSPIYRDSIALAWSPDGSQWAFLRYLLEPDQSTCFAVQSQWARGALVKVSDPYLFQDGEVTRVFYTSTRYTPDNSLGCSAIGTAAYDSTFKQIFRNDDFLVDLKKCSSTQSGIARPTVRWNSNGNTLWYDSDYKVYSIPLTAVNQMSINQGVVEQATSGVDVELPYLDSGVPLVLSTGGGYGINSIVARSLNGDQWSTPWPLVGLSGQEYDSWYQRTPFLMVENDGLCTPVLYYSGVKKTVSGAQEASIARAFPTTKKQFKFIQCFAEGTPPIPTVSLLSPIPTKTSTISTTPKPNFLTPTPTLTIKFTPTPTKLPPPVSITRTPPSPSQRLTPTPFPM